MKLTFLSILIFSVLGLVEKCDKTKVDENAPSLGKSVDVKMEEATFFPTEKLELLLKDKKDSRCPAETNCIRAGEATITLVVNRAPETETIQLQSKGMCREDDGSCGNQKKVLGYTIKLLNVYPYPGTEEAKAKEKVFARLIVEKAD